MSVEQNQSGVVSGGGSGAVEPAAGGVGDTARSEASNVAATAAGGAREVAGEAGVQARVVAGEAKQQLERLVSQGRGELREQAEQRAAQAAGQLRTWSEQVGALLAGRPEGAGPLVGYAGDVQGQLRRWAARLEQAGPEGVVDDVTRFARRRPGVFLAGAAGIGFVVGRLVRAGAASGDGDGSSGGEALAAPSYGPGYEAPLPPPPPGGRGGE
jgi:hypothetical protein